MVRAPSPRLVALTFFAVALALYAPSIQAPFVFDGTNLVHGSLLHVTAIPELGRVLFAEGVPRRIGLASFALNFYADGLRPFGYHLVNVLLHAANAVLLFAILLTVLGSLRPDLKRAGRLRLAAALGAGLWLVHPVQTQAVSYVYQRFTVLCVFFYLASIAVWITSRRARGGTRAALQLLCASLGLLALGTKEIAATLPLVLLVLHFGVFRGPPFSLEWSGRDRSLLALALAVTLGISAVFLGPDFLSMMADDYARRGFTLGERLLTESRVIVHYQTLMVAPLPSRLTLDYDVPLSTGIVAPPATLASILLLLGVGGLALARARRWPLFCFATLWWALHLAIESSFVPLDLAYEHRLYLPGMMVCAWATAGVVGLDISPRLRSAAAVGMLGLASLWTFQRNVVWSDPVRLWSDTAAKSPGKARVHANLGVSLAEKGRAAEASAALERAVELDPSLLVARVALANLAIDEGGDLDRAEHLLEGVVRDDPAHAPALVGLGVLELRRGALESAAQRFREALSHEEAHREALYNLGVAYFRQEDFGAAATVLERGVETWPKDAAMLALSGAAWFEAGDPARAAPVLRRSLELAPEGALAARYLSHVEEQGSSDAVSK